MSKASDPKRPWGEEDDEDESPVIIVNALLVFCMLW